MTNNNGGDLEAGVPARRNSASQAAGDAGPAAFQAICFDLDGTLLDTLDDISDSMNAALAERGLPGHSPELYKVYVGDGMDTLARRVVPEARRGNAAFLASLVAGMRAQYARRWKTKTRPYPGVHEMLDGLAARGLKLAVLSNKPDDFTRIVVAEYFARWKFESVLGARAAVPKKPDPAGALEIAAAAGIEPARFLYLGDTDTDMRTAQAAGMFALGALWGFRPAEELLASGARALVSAPLDVLKFLD